MIGTEKLKIKKWIDTWNKADSAIQGIRQKELQSDSYYQKRQVLLNEMLEYACEHRKIRISSGLIEQQRIFMKLYNKNKV